MYWFPYSSHTSHYLSETHCLPWISYATKKLMLISCRMVQNSLKHSICFCGIFSKFKNMILLHIVLLKCPHVHIVFLKLTSCDNQASGGVYSNSCCSCSFESEIIKIGWSSHKMYTNNIPNFQVSTTISNACTKSLVTYWMHHVFTSGKRKF